MKLHENPSDGNRAVADRRTDKVKLLVAAHFVSSPKTFPPTESLSEWVGEWPWLTVQDMHNYTAVIVCSRIPSPNSQQFCMTTFSTSLTNLTAVLPQSRDCSCYVSRPVVAPPPLWLQKRVNQRAHDFAHSPNLWNQPRLASITFAWSWILRGINPAVTSNTFFFFYLTCYFPFHKLSFNFDWENSIILIYFLIHWPSSWAQHMRPTPSYWASHSQNFTSQ